MTGRRKKEQRFYEPHSGELLVEKNRYRNAANWPKQKENQPVNVVAKRRPKLLIFEKLLIVGQTNELLVDSNPIPFEEAEPKGLENWNHHINGEDDRRRCDKEPRRYVMTAHVAPPFGWTTPAWLVALGEFT